MNPSEFMKIAHDKMKEHNLINWIFRYNSRKWTFGSCVYHKTEIKMSRLLVERNTLEECLNTLMHEIAHALVGPGIGHSEVWKKKAVEIGCNGERCFDPDRVNMIPKLWQAYCPNCQINRGQYYRRKKLMHRACHTPLIYKKIT